MLKDNWYLENQHCFKNILKYIRNLIKKILPRHLQVSSSQVPSFASHLRKWVQTRLIIDLWCIIFLSFKRLISELGSYHFLTFKRLINVLWCIIFIIQKTHHWNMVISFLNIQKTTMFCDASFPIIQTKWRTLNRTHSAISLDLKMKHVQNSWLAVFICKRDIQYSSTYCRASQSPSNRTYCCLKAFLAPHVL